MQTSSLRLRLTASLAAVLIASLGDATAAGPFEELHRQAVVNYYDLDLAKPGDVAELYMRIRRAARTVCTEPGVAGATMNAVRRACIAEAVEEAVESIGAAPLTSYHIARTRGAIEPVRTAA